MYLGIRQLVISSFFLPLSCDSFATFLFPFPSLPISHICVPLMQLSLSGVLHSFARSGPRHRRQLLQLLLLHPPLLLFLQRVEWHLRQSWHSLCAWMLALTLSAMSCVRWTPVSVVSCDDRLWWVVTQWLPLQGISGWEWWLRQSWWCWGWWWWLSKWWWDVYLMYLPLYHLWQKGEVVLRWE